MPRGMQTAAARAFKWRERADVTSFFQKRREAAYQSAGV